MTLTVDGNTKERFRARADVVLSGSSAARYLTDLTSGQVYELNETAARIFELASGGAARAVITETLAKEHADIPRDELERDVRDLLQDFLKAGVLEPLA